MRYLLVFLLLAVACGSAEHQKEKSAAVKRWGKDKGVAAKSFINEPYATPSPSSTSEPVDAMVVVVGAPTSTETTIEGMTYVSAPVTWADAMMKAPAGKRLASRDELFALWDNGTLKGLKFSTGVVWSASAKDSSEAWALSTFDGSLVFSSMNGLLSAVYVDDLGKVDHIK